MDSLYKELRFNASAAALLDHWMNLRSPAAMCPNKQDFNPMMMGKHLPDVFMAEFVDEDHVMVRVAGSRTTDVTRRDTTGDNILDNGGPLNKETLEHFYAKMRTGLFAGVSEHHLVHAARPSSAITLQLPLLDTNGKANFFVGVIRAAPLDDSAQNIPRNLETAQTVIHTSFTNLNVQRAPIESKLG